MEFMIKLILFLALDILRYVVSNLQFFLHVSHLAKNLYHMKILYIYRIFDLNSQKYKII